MLWGAGSALGEVPPYYMTYSAASAGLENESVREVQRAENRAEKKPHVRADDKTQTVSYVVMCWSGLSHPRKH